MPNDWELAGSNKQDGEFGDYVGVVSKVLQNGCGFVDCQEIKDRHGRDAYIHDSVMRRCSLAPGDEISFNLHINSSGNPQVSAPVWKRERDEQPQPWRAKHSDSSKHSGYRSSEQYGDDPWRRSTKEDSWKRPSSDTWARSTREAEAPKRDSSRRGNSSGRGQDRERKPRKRSLEKDTRDSYSPRPLSRAREPHGDRSHTQREDGMHVGTVISMDVGRGHSMVECPDLEREVYVHHSTAEPSRLQVDDLVAFRIHVGHTGRPLAEPPFWKLVGFARRRRVVPFGDFQGRVRRVTPTGHAFVECEALASRFDGDVFVHETVMSQCGLRVGDNIAFSLHISPNGQPQVSAPCWLRWTTDPESPGEDRRRGGDSSASGAGRGGWKVRRREGALQGLPSPGRPPLERMIPEKRNPTPDRQREERRVWETRKAREREEAEEDRRAWEARKAREREEAEEERRAWEARKAREREEADEERLAWETRKAREREEADEERRAWETRKAREREDADEATLKVGWMPPGFYLGWVRKSDRDRGVSMVCCPDLHHSHDVYVHRSVAEPEALRVGDLVGFRVHVNARGMPQASAPFWKQVGWSSPNRPVSFGEHQGLVNRVLQSGSGFVECKEMGKTFDAFIHRTVMEQCDLVEGNFIAFNLHMSSDEKQQVSSPCWICCSDDKKMKDILSSVISDAPRRRRQPSRRSRSFQPHESRERGRSQVRSRSLSDEEKDVKDAGPSRHEEAAGQEWATGSEPEAEEQQTAAESREAPPSRSASGSREDSEEINPHFPR